MHDPQTKGTKMNAFARNAILPLFGAIAIALLVGGCEARVEAPGPPGIAIGFPGVEIVDAHGYHHHGYYDDHHRWHGGWDDERHVHHDDPGDWHR
jgi:hypothetical protein